MRRGGAEYQLQGQFLATAEGRLVWYYGSGLEYKMKDPSYLIAQVDNPDFFDFTFVDDNRAED